GRGGGHATHAGRRRRRRARSGSAVARRHCPASAVVFSLRMNVRKAYPAQRPGRPAVTSDVAGGIVLGLVARLRQVGVPVSTWEAVDAVLALEAAGVADRERARAALRATLVKRRDD